MAKRRAKPLLFEYEGTEVTFDMIKVDRSKLYGFKEQEVIDDVGRTCELATLAEDGRTVIGKGGTGIGYLSADGRWADKASLKPVDIEGVEIEPVPSSFGTPIPLSKTVPVEEFLNHNIRLCYVMQAESVNESLASSLSEGKIYSFPYSYRGGLVSDSGFLLMNSEKQIFFLVGDATVVEMVGLQQAASVVPEDESSEEDGDDLMDFGMI